MKVERNRFKRIIVVALVTAIATSIIGCFPPQDNKSKIADVPEVPEGEFNYGGSTTFAPLRSQKILEAINKAHPQFKLRYTNPSGNENPGSGTGINMLLRGKLAFSQSSRSVKNNEFKEAQKQGFKLQEKSIAIDAVAFYVNPELIDRGVKGITLDEVKKIFTGEINNWKELGGPNIAIIPFSRNLQAGGTVDFFYEKVLGKNPFGNNYEEIKNTTEGIRKVAKKIGGIGYATASELIKQKTIKLLPLAHKNNSDFISPCKADTCEYINEKQIADGYYPLTRRLFIVIKLDGKIHEQAGISYTDMLLTDEGKDLIRDAGFVPKK